MPDIFNIVETRIGKAERALKFITQNSFFMAFGKPTAWNTEEGTSDSNPPAPLANETNIPEPFILIRCNKVVPIIETGCGDISFSNCGTVQALETTWTQIDIENTSIEKLGKLNLQYLYIETTLESQHFGVNNNYRAAGLFLNPEFVEGVDTTLIAYTPDKIETYGSLLWVCYSTPIEKIEGQSNIVGNLLSF